MVRTLHQLLAVTDGREISSLVCLLSPQLHSSPTLAVSLLRMHQLFFVSTHFPNPCDHTLTTSQSVSRLFLLLQFTSSTGKDQCSESAHHLHNNFPKPVASQNMEDVVSPYFQLALDEVRSLGHNKILESDRPWAVVNIVMRVKERRRERLLEAGRTAMLLYLTMPRCRDVCNLYY